MKTSVLIVGAGPTGLTLAAELGRRSVDCIIIDALEGPMSWDRATIIHPRTMELLSSVGVSDELLDVGVHQRFIDIYSDGEHLGRMDLAETDSPFGFNVNVSEEVTERAMSRHLHANGGAVRYSHRLIGMQLTDDRVLARIEHAGGSTSSSPTGSSAAAGSTVRSGSSAASRSRATASLNRGRWWIRLSPIGPSDTTRTSPFWITVPSFSPRCRPPLACVHPTDLRHVGPD